MLAQYDHKVFYLDDPKLGHPWKVVQKIQYRHLWDVPEKEDVEDIADTDSGDENDKMSAWEVQADDDETITSLRKHDVEPAVIIVNDANKERSASNEGDFINDESADDDESTEENATNNDDVSDDDAMDT